MTVPSSYAALYQSTIEEAAAGGQAIIGKLVMAVRKSLQERLLTARDLREREVYETSLRHLHAQEPGLAVEYPKALLAAFSGPVLATKAPVMNLSEVQFDQLELMDEVQVQESVTMARAQQMALLAAESSLAELNTLICSTLGLATVRPERNPLRPDVYLQTLKLVVERAPVPASMRLDWLTTMGVGLGAELRDLYTRLAARMRAQGVVAAGYAVVPTPGGGAVGSGRTPVSGLSYGVAGSAEREAAIAAEMQKRRPTDPALLTLDRLRKLLSGELDAAPTSTPRVAAFAQQFAQQFEGEELLAPPPRDGGFASTVPAALEALTEMKQVDRMVQRIEQRRAAPARVAPAGSVQQACEVIRRKANGVAQTLSLEVVNLMVDTIARDPRLLPPVQELVRSLEPALMQLALVDPRLFTDKQHGARLLVQELTHRSLAFASEQTTGFALFYGEVRDAVAPLAEADVQGPEVFEIVLAQLREQWAAAAKAQEASRAQAVQALQRVEQRNLLAEKIAREIDSHPDAPQVPEVVIAFLCGPWAQVVAQARLQAGAGSTAADKYQALISAMLWSAHPELARSNVAKLTRLVPLLISTLREGLDSIHYPATKTSAFLEALMGLHQQVFRMAAKPEPVPASTTALAASLRQEKDGDPWVAPEEARDSNFIEMPDLPDPPKVPAPATADAAATEARGDEEPAQVSLAGALVRSGGLSLGSWVELMTHGEWVRTQLTWASPHGTLFLFTSVYGTTQSMTRRTLSKLVAGQQLRLISGQPVVDGALDAVAQQAMRNSVDSTR